MSKSERGPCLFPACRGQCGRNERCEPACTLYRYLWLTDLGYVVYRYNFDAWQCTVEEWARVHKSAVFVEEIAAKDYCRYRNALVDLNGDDRLSAN